MVRFFRYGLLTLMGLGVVLGVFLAQPTAFVQGADGVVASTGQTFENGWMMWRSDTGSIYVFLNNGRFFHFPSESYGALPFNTLPYNGFVSPVLGFGQVWANYDWLREAVGNGVGSEFSFNPRIVDHRFGLTTVEDWNGRQIQTLGVVWVMLPRVAGAFVPTPTPVPPVPMPTLTPSVPTYTYITDGAFQLYENGFMVWRADTGDILVFYGDFLNGVRGTMLLVPVSWYQEFPENSQPPVPEPFYNPINGFGRVWGTLSDVRTRLGYARTDETAYSIMLELERGAYGKGWLTMPDGTRLFILNGEWTF